MAKNPYTPTLEQLARYRKEMERWRDAVLVNKKYYDQIFSDMKEFEAKEGREAAVMDMLDAMQRQGNLPYVMQYDYLDEHNPEVPFKKIVQDHDETHIFLRMPHTPEGEQRMVFADAATKYHMGKGFDDATVEEYINKASARYKNLDQNTYKPEERHRSVTPVARDKAIDFAFSWYLKEKSFLAFELSRTQDFEEADEQIRNYADNDRVSERQVGIGVNGYFLYEILLLSDKERESIIAVATGLKKPQETPYPKRMERVLAALTEIGLFHDMKPWAERAIEKSAENHPEGKGFDPEKFKAARDKRGAPKR